MGVQEPLTSKGIQGGYAEPQVVVESKEHPWSFEGVDLEFTWSPGVCALVKSSPCEVHI